MTQPVPHGYPDWGRYQATGDKILSSEASTVTSVLINRGRFFVGDVQAVNIDFSATVLNFQVRLGFYDSATAGLFLGNYAFECNTNGDFSRALPVQGPWLNVEVTPSGANAEFSMIVRTASQPHANNAGTPDANLLYASAVNQAWASGITNVDIPDVWPGQATFYVELPATLFDVQLHSRSYLGNNRFLTRVIGTNAQIERRPILPATSLRLIVNNTAAGSQNSTISLSVNPWDA